MPTRTSSSHPLRIDTLELGRGRLGLTFCPGKQQRGALTGNWERNLEADLDAIQDWGASAVVSAIEPHELVALGVPQLGERVEARGMDWYPVPIRDVDVPDERAEHMWSYVAARLRGLLAGGGSAVIHCKGGLGRTGTLAALLVAGELGVTADEAIAQVRRARPGAIETADQEAYVRRVAAAANPASDRILGCLLGGAIGDAFGYTVEFMRLHDIRARYGPDGLTEPVFDDGKLVVTDDTQMTLFTIEGMCLARDPANPESLRASVHAAYLRWLETQRSRNAHDGPEGWLLRERVLYARRAPGITCMSALESGVCGTIDEPINDSKGCGGVMRVAPVGLHTGWSADQAFDLAASFAAITHGHPSGYWSSGAMARIIRDLLDGAELPAAIEGALARLHTVPRGDETATCLQKAVTLANSPSDTDTAIRELGQGWVGEEALAIAAFAMLRAATFTDAIRIAANHDGDSDSTASLAGQLWGATHGLDGIPNAWTRRVDVLGPVLRSASTYEKY